MTSNLEADDDPGEADEIMLRELAEQERRCISGLLTIWIRIGDILISRKKRYPRGTWRPWLKVHKSVKRCMSDVSQIGKQRSLVPGAGIGRWGCRKKSDSQGG